MEALTVHLPYKTQSLQAAGKNPEAASHQRWKENRMKF